MKHDMCLLFRLYFGLEQVLFRLMWDNSFNIDMLSVFICTFVRKSEEEILQKPFQKGRHSQVAHRSSHSNEVDR